MHLPTPVEHLQVVVPQVIVEKVVHANDSPLYLVDLEEGVDHETDRSSSQHWEPVLVLHFLSHLKFCPGPQSS